MYFIQLQWANEAQMQQPKHNITSFHSMRSLGLYVHINVYKTKI